MQKLQQIARKEERTVLGLMSGTSMDGLDIALCRFTGSGAETSFVLDHFVSIPYDEETRQPLLALANAPCPDPEQLCIWNTYLAHVHADMVNEALQQWGRKSAEVDLLASHGQTIHHAPRHKHRRDGMPNATFQIGDGDHLAHRTGIITISDFRQRDTARGNEGAPLAAFGDYLLFRPATMTRILLNIGGIANFTLLRPEEHRMPPFATDTGPGNTLIDAATSHYFEGLAYDKDGGLAAYGRPDPNLLSLLKAHPYFERNAPKTTGFEMFHMDWVHECMEAAGFDRPAEDLLATLTRFTAGTISTGIRKVLHEGEKAEVFVSGGGIHNRVLMEQLTDDLSPLPVRTTKEIGMDEDAKEAVLFAALANELICGEDPRLHFGKISLTDH
ncbi:anhydro-N-acetylmuramic acid kinase [Balneolales bacterium ANBcel1]|nr:anhydro-N-acetylmuramic acid kinase [Balneolales bacterium ANBcel1]